MKNNSMLLDSLELKELSISELTSINGGEDLTFAQRLGGAVGTVLGVVSCLCACLIKVGATASLKGR